MSHPTEAIKMIEKFKNISYKKKNRLLLAAVLLMTLFIYTKKIKKTIAAYTEYSAMKDKVALAENAPRMAEQLQRELSSMDQKIGTQSKEQNIAQTLLELVTNYCQANHAVLREFPETTSNNQGDLQIETNQFVVEGNFATLLNLVYQLEQKNKLGKISSVKYQLKKDYKTKEMALTASIFLQNCQRIAKGNLEIK